MCLKNLRRENQNLKPRKINNNKLDQVTTITTKIATNWAEKKEIEKNKVIVISHYLLNINMLSF